MLLHLDAIPIFQVPGSRSNVNVHGHGRKMLLFGRPFVKRFALCYRTVVLSVLSCVYDVGALWLNGWMDQDET